ncbi:MAG TPA: aspartate ammonia-lyase [Armatimonadota bacterium]|nr:aspartate ammonia-lyase [Armatimonadota bacterium]
MDGAEYRLENDQLGDVPVPGDALYGAHTVRALANFPLARRPVPAVLVRAFGAVKLACAQTNRALGQWSGDPGKADAIVRACSEMLEGLLSEHVVVDLLQGGAGTSMNMNVNEVLANRALDILGEPRGHYARVSPLDDINRQQSTNDTYPTALRVAAIWELRDLEARLVALQESFQAAERRFAHIVKVGRTQYQDAVLTTLGREMGAYAEAINRDRWRVYKCEERLRVVNLGGTAIGTGLGASREFIFRATDALRQVTGIGVARAENLVEATQNADVFVEVSGILKACAASMFKICTDLRLMSSGPEAGLGELRLPPRQAGSSIMPGKVNPVIPEAVSQVALLVMGYDGVTAMACASGSLELNPFLPLVAFCLLESIQLLTAAADTLRTHCIDGLEANEERCHRHVEGSTAVATALVPVVGYSVASDVAADARRTGRTVRQVVVDRGLLAPAEFDALISPEAVCRLGGS